MLARGLKYGLIFSLAVLMLASCYTVTTMETEVLRPAKYDFKPDVYRVGVVSRMDLEYLREDLRKDTELLEKFQRDSSILKNGVLGMLDGLAESPRFVAYKIDPERTLKGDATSLSRPLSWRQVNSLAKKDSLDLVICLTATTFSDTVHRPVNLFRNEQGKAFSTMSDGKNDIIRDDLKNSPGKHYIMFPLIYWRIYELHDSKITELIQGDTLIFEPGPVNGGYPTTKQTIEIFNDAVGYMGYEYSRVLAPYWMTVDRAWFPDGNYALRKASLLAEEGQWKEAGEIWRELAYDDNRRLAARASFNMALASEMMDEFEIAIEWVNRSIELGLDYYPPYYLQVLKKRQKDKELLDIQMK